MQLRAEPQIPDLMLGGNFRIPGYSMIYAQGMAQEHGRKYFLYFGKTKINGQRRRWLVSATDEDCGNYIYVEGGPGSQGFGGACLRFQLAPCGYIELVGPWHSNSSSLFMDTGIDVRDKYLTFGVIARRRALKDVPDNQDRRAEYLEDIVYFDEKPTLGHHERVRDIAQRMANEMQERLFAYNECIGGSSHGAVYPSKKE